MLRFKPGFRCLGLRPEIILAIVIVRDLYRELGVTDCWLTHGIEGTHSVGSEHYTGLAVDVRVHNVPPEKREVLIAALKEALGTDFDVLWEAKGTDQEHLHVEYDPKQPY